MNIGRVVDDLRFAAEECGKGIRENGPMIVTNDRKELKENPLLTTLIRVTETLCRIAESDISSIQCGEMSQKFPWGSRSVRLRRGFERIDKQDRPETIGDMLCFGKTKLMTIKGLGETAANEVGDIMSKYGLLDEWECT